MATGVHITDQLCACGCGTKMLSTVVDRGWKYLRNHKSADLRPAKADAAPKRTVKTRPMELTSAKTYSYADAKALVQAELPCLEEQRDELRAEGARIAESLMFVERRIHALTSLLDSVALLTLPLNAGGLGLDHV